MARNKSDRAKSAGNPRAAHARTGDRFAIAAHVGNSDEFDQAIARFAKAYAKQNEQDYRKFLKALEAGM